MKTLIVVPARFASTRLPGKPLVPIAGRSMISRVADMADKAAQTLGHAMSVVATDDERILAHCRDHNIQAVMTDPALPSGTDRALAAVDALGIVPEIVVNLQGDSPFTPAAHVAAVAKAASESGADAATPYVRLTWEALDNFRVHKTATPFSGTTLVCRPDGHALWFSKSLIPAIRKEAALRKESSFSPVLRHIGLYAFQLDALRRYVRLPESHYEKLEGLEQLRFLENGMTMQCVEVEPDRIAIPGIDTAEDVALAERLIAQHGDPAEA